jgi:SP family general alpha glucoside:H+ symporter-like MFS transporter
MMIFMTWLTVTIFIPVFAPSLPVLAFGEAMCGIAWGVFQVCIDSVLVKLTTANITIRTKTLSTTYASEVVPTVLRPYVTAYVCMCWGAGILISSGVVRAVVNVNGNLGWRIPFVFQ